LPSGKNTGNERKEKGAFIPKGEGGPPMVHRMGDKRASHRRTGLDREKKKRLAGSESIAGEKSSCPNEKSVPSKLTREPAEKGRKSKTRKRTRWKATLPQNDENREGAE